jgi:hypothetical protein
MSDKDWDKALEKEVKNLQNWMRRIERRMIYIQETFYRTGKSPRPKSKIEQLDLFAG